MDSVQLDIENNEFIITIPALPCPFPWRTHPDALEQREMSDAWLVDRCKRIPAACKSTITAKLFSVNHLVNSAYYLVASLYFANAVSTQRTLPILKLMNWFFMLDTCVDEPSEFGVDPANAELVIKSAMALFEPTSNDKIAPDPNVQSEAAILQDSGTLDKIASDNRSSGSQNGVDEIAHILTDAAEEWWSDMRVDMTLSQQARFRESFKGYLRAILRETPFRSARHLPDVHTYIHIRASSIGWYPLVLLNEYSLCIELDEEAFTNPLILALTKSLCESILLVNDVTSFGKEYMRGDLFNIIMVLCFHKLLLQCTDSSSCSLPNSWPCLATPVLLQECMFEACEMITKRIQECARLIEEIKGTSLLMQKPGMESFLEAMANTVSGNIYWHLRSERYGVLCANGMNDKLHSSTTGAPNVNIGSYYHRLSPIKL